MNLAKKFADVYSAATAAQERRSAEEKAEQSVQSAIKSKDQEALRGAMAQATEVCLCVSARGSACSVAFGASFECALLCREQRGAPATPGLIAAMEEASKALQLFNRCVRGRQCGCYCCCCCLYVEERVLNAISRGLQSEITAEIERALAAKDQDTLRKCLAVRCQTGEVSIVRRCRRRSACDRM
jgi:hypothetical protein